MAMNPAVCCVHTSEFCMVFKWGSLVVHNHFQYGLVISKSYSAYMDLFTQHALKANLCTP